jgi:hypothetical protein
MREQKVKDGSIALEEASVGPIELEPSIRLTARLDPQPDHVLDAEWTGDLLVEGEAMEFALG